MLSRLQPQGGGNPFLPAACCILCLCSPLAKYLAYILFLAAGTLPIAFRLESGGSIQIGTMEFMRRNISVYYRCMSEFKQCPYSWKQGSKIITEYIKMLQ